MISATILAEPNQFNEGFSHESQLAVSTVAFLQAVNRGDILSTLQQVHILTHYMPQMLSEKGGGL